MGLFKKPIYEHNDFNQENDMSLTSMDMLINEVYIQEIHRDFLENKVILYNELTKRKEDIKEKHPNLSEEICIRNACSFLAFPFSGKIQMEEDELKKVSNELYHLYFKLKELIND